MSKYNSDWIERNSFYKEVPMAGETPLFVSYERPVVVCLCGSTRFKAAWYEQTKRLTYEGHIVLGVGDLDPNAPNTNVPLDPELKARLDYLHKRKIDLADTVFVLNVGGYVGESTRSEIEYAGRRQKPVLYLEPPKEK